MLDAALMAVVRLLGSTDGNAMLTERLQIRVSPAEKSSFEASARLQGLDLSVWVRNACCAAAERTTDQEIGGDDPDTGLWHAHLGEDAENG